MIHSKTKSDIEQHGRTILAVFDTVPPFASCRRSV